MSGTQITFTDDARRPKVITFGGTPLVRWYAYLRDGQGGRLFLRREDNGVLASEILVVEANPPPLPAVDSAGVTWFDFVVDPADGTMAHLYFIADGTLWRSTITSTPVGEEPTTQQFNRANNRYENLPNIYIPNTPFEAFKRLTTIPTPTIVLVESPTPAMVRLIIGLVLPQNPIFEADRLELVTLPNGGNGTVHGTFAIPEGRQIILDVPENAVTFTKWAVRAVRDRPKMSSVYASVIDDGSFDADAPLPFLGLSTPFEPFMQKLNRQPIKTTVVEPDLQSPLAVSTPFEPFMRKLDRSPIKTPLEEPAFSSTLSVSTPFEPFMRKS